MPKLETKRAKRARWLPAQGARCIKSLQRSFVQIQRSRASSKARWGGRQVMGYDGRWWHHVAPERSRHHPQQPGFSASHFERRQEMEWDEHGWRMDDGGMKGKEMSWERCVSSFNWVFPKQMGCLKKSFLFPLFLYLSFLFQGQSHDVYRGHCSSQGQPLTMMDSKTKADGQRVSQFEDKWDIVGRHADGDILWVLVQHSGEKTAQVRVVNSKNTGCTGCRIVSNSWVDKCLVQLFVYWSNMIARNTSGYVKAV